ncbi:[Fe-Fe] hydrogenase large subunit C-terminal domain-containing protein [Propionispora hippei]|uniref:Iron only hydrogenase large subunit, C-terminal domain n=1 Tax=Propionispora hippei DSM 15287 TaxID=1123003 RepID=A0A1M6I7Z4_9FIRM|nr:[Fe-Fe] hydrogenase large subunit C-terminal domain-containing protein [Propionispora hippei]SHJ30591.1 Iron only hydrogenase large subunit, C-terminal domain [Propionispora hippei DSM 15287]
MITFKELYSRIKQEVAAREDINWESLSSDEFDKSQLSCLFSPEQHPVHQSIQECLEKAEAGSLTISRDVLASLKSLAAKQTFAYVLIAPSFLGQFHEQVTPGMLRNAFRHMGLDGMVEVAVFADILTIKEALEFDRNILSEKDFQLTSCCCPMWIAMIRKVYSELMPHVPATVSPMIAAGRTVKILHPGSVTIFVGPCVAKKSEARETNLAGAIDHVLTYQETKELFDLLQIDLTSYVDSEKENSSRGGRIYARAGGVSEAVQRTVERLNPNRTITIKTRMADGVPNCRIMMNELLEGQVNANFFEGMGCSGGCVGGPKVLVDKEFAKNRVDAYGAKAVYKTPIENPYVIELLHRLGFETPDSLLADNEFFTRRF